MNRSATIPHFLLNLEPALSPTSFREPTQLPVFTSVSPLSSPLQSAKKGATTQLLISEQQWAGRDRFAKTNNLISGSAASISSAQKSLEERVKIITSPMLLLRLGYIWTSH